MSGSKNCHNETCKIINHAAKKQICEQEGNLKLCNNTGKKNQKEKREWRTWRGHLPRFIRIIHQSTRDILHHSRFHSQEMTRERRVYLDGPP